MPSLLKVKILSALKCSASSWSLGSRTALFRFLASLPRKTTAKLAPGDILVAENQSGSATSELKIEFVRSSFYPTLQYMLEMAEATAKEGNYTETNRSEMVFRDNQQMSWEEISTKLQTS